MTTMTRREAEQKALEEFLMNGAFARSEIDMMKQVPLSERPDYTLENMAIAAEEVLKRAGIEPLVRIEKGVAGTSYYKISYYPMTFGNLEIVEKKRLRKNPEQRNISRISMLRPVTDDQGNMIGKQEERISRSKHKDPMVYRVKQTLKGGAMPTRSCVLDKQDATNGQFFHDYRGIVGTFKSFERFICDAQEMAAPGDFNRLMIRTGPRQPK
jgi:hypothetical protein